MNNRNGRCGIVVGQIKLNRTTVSVVVPLLNERDRIEGLWLEMQASIERFGRPLDLIFRDDGSTDGSAQALDELVSRHREDVTAIHLRRNFWKSAALAASFDQAYSDVIVTMDGDLQDDPSEIPRFLEAIATELDVVSDFKKNCKDSRLRMVASRVFNWMVRRTTGIRLHDVNCGFKAMRKEVVDELVLYGELHRFIPILASWLGFRVGEIVVAHRSRTHGRSRFGFGRYFRGPVDLSTVAFGTRFHTRLAHFVAAFGTASIVAGLLICTFIAVLSFGGVPPIGKPLLLILALLFVVTGIQSFGFGLLAELIVGCLQTPSRPYVIARAVTRGRVREPERDSPKVDEGVAG